MTHTIEASMTLNMGEMTSILFVKPIYDTSARGMQDTLMLKGGMHEAKNM